MLRILAVDKNVTQILEGGDRHGIFSLAITQAQLMPLLCGFTATSLLVNANFVPELFGSIVGVLIDVTFGEKEGKGGAGAVRSTGREANGDGFIDKDAIVVCIWTAALDRLFEGLEPRRKGFKVEDGEVKRMGIRIKASSQYHHSKN